MKPYVHATMEGVSLLGEIISSARGSAGDGESVVTSLGEVLCPKVDDHAAQAS